ncbi:MAG TPA: DUF1440 domain-containing protein [Blastocatellia bacterium]|nr:DUF1440 domain-containing protein [Blastocatellia bacterium]
MRIFRRKKQELWKGLVAGAAGGLVASWVMNEFQALWSRRTHGIDRSHGAQSLQHGLPRRGVARELQARGEDREGDNATVRIARLISEDVFGHRLAESEKETAGAVAHYAMGATSGAVYGAAAELLPTATAGAGLPFGAAVWLIADELIVPALGLSKPPAAYPLSTHAYALASHLVYGLSTEMMRRAVRRAL